MDKKKLWCLWIRYEAPELPTSHQTINANIHIQPLLPQWIVKRCATVAFVYNVYVRACVPIWWELNLIWTGIWLSLLKAELYCITALCLDIESSKWYWFSIQSFIRNKAVALKLIWQSYHSCQRIGEKAQI